MDLKALILEVARKSFPSATVANFSRLFGKEIDVVEQMLEHKPSSEPLRLFSRNLLILLWHLKHSLSTRTACILFGLEKSQYWTVVNYMLAWLVDTYEFLISFKHRFSDQIDEFLNTFTVIDCTELEIWRYGPKNPADPAGFRDIGYSGKKRRFTIKYQLICGCISGRIYHVYGPEFGSIHDAKIYQNSGIDQFFWGLNEYCLGDRGYQGCLNILSPHKNYGELLTAAEKLHNSNIGKYRHIIERVFGSLKQWNILSQRYRGHYEGHFKVFMAVCILITL